MNTAESEPTNPYTERCAFRCPCHEPEWCADNPAVGCDLCKAYHGHLTLSKFDQ
jgi:hypothetical protein